MGGSPSHTMALPVVINATAKHTASLIFLHGLGDTGHGWASAFEMIRAPHINYIFPTAKSIPVTLNGGMSMPSWFDIFGLGPESPQDNEGIKSASQSLQSLISEEEKKGIPRSRIAIGGFSQGGAVALYSAIMHDQSPLAGIVGLSTWMPLHQQVAKSPSLSNRNVPILQCHGTDDPMVPFQFAKMTSMLLKSVNTQSEFKEYPGLGHSSSQQELNDVKEFISKILPSVS